MGNEVKNSSKYYKIYQLYRNKHMKNVFSEEGNSGAHNLNASLRLFLHKCLSGCYRSKYASGLYFRLKLVSYKNQTKHHYAYLIVGSSYWCLSANCHLYRHYHTLKKRGGPYSYNEVPNEIISHGQTSRNPNTCRAFRGRLVIVRSRL